MSDGNLFSIGAICAGTGAVAIQMVPNYIAYGYAFLVFGVVSMIAYFFSKNKFDIFFRSINFGTEDAYPMMISKKRHDGYLLYEFSLPVGQDVDELKKHQTALEQFVGAPVEIAYGFKNLLIKVFNRPPEIYRYKPEDIKGDLVIPAGYDQAGRFRSLNLSNDEPHVIIGGITGSGKSSLIRVIITFLTLFRHKTVELFLVDLKRGAELGRFKNCENVTAFAKTPEEARGIILSLLNEVQHRYDLFEAADVVNIKEYNKKAADKMKYLVLIIDEYSLLCSRREDSEAVEFLVCLSRACGISVIIATQKPDAKTISTRVSAMCGNVIGMRVESAADSVVVIGHKGLEALPLKGYAILKNGDGEINIRVPWLDAGEAKNLIIPYTVTKLLKKSEPKTITDFGFLDRL